jgi:hypothetical protein
VAAIRPIRVAIRPIRVAAIRPISRDPPAGLEPWRAFLCVA